MAVMGLHVRKTEFWRAWEPRRRAVLNQHLAGRATKRDKMADHGLREDRAISQRLVFGRGHKGKDQPPGI
jgi:hypothetical protein